jgi:hypothetical protein
VAKVNQHPQTHQLVVLSMEWDAFSYLIIDLVLTHTAPQLTFFWLVTFDHYFFWSFF